MNLIESETSGIVKHFFSECANVLKSGFEFESNEQQDVEEDSTYVPSFNEELLTKSKVSLNSLIAKYNRIDEGHPSEVFFLSLKKGVREAVNEEINSNLNANEPILNGILSDGELKLLIKELTKEYSDIPNAQLILHCFYEEIEKIVFEYHIISAISYNKVKLENTTDINSFDIRIGSYERDLIKAKNELEEAKITLDNTKKELQYAKEERDKIKAETQSIKKETKLIKKETKSIVSMVSKEKKSLSEYTSTTVKSFRNSIKKSEKKMHESNVTILGIFSAVVLAFNTTVGFYSSTIDAFSHSSTYKILLILLVIGFVTSSVLMGLFFYLGTICNSSSTNVIAKASGDKKIYKVIKEKLSGLKGLVPFLITDAIILILLIVVMITWNLGAIEHRNKEVYDKIFQDATSKITLEITIDNFTANK
ncbi:MAG: hypothetical protein IJA52_00370 [Clostridia bacterium]|nr:hypothetical protein [Clostridia bacterium]